MPGRLLKDDEIAREIASGSLKVDGIDVFDHNDFKKLDQVQPSSLDLRIGKIYVPPEEIIKKDEFEHYAPTGVKGCLVPAGGAVVVETKENLTLDSTIAAFGFPPASLSSRAILMTNPGHVDPGYSGTLHFTLINMGREPYQLDADALIVSLLVFKFDSPVSKNYFDRRGGEMKPTNKATMLNTLSPDFGNISERIEKATAKSIESKLSDLEKKFDWAKLVVPALGGVATAVAIWFTTSIPPMSQIVTKSSIAGEVTTQLNKFDSDLEKINKSLANFDEKSLDLDVDLRLDKIEANIQQLLAAIKSAKEN